jgi:hypothetical protein
VSINSTAAIENWQSSIDSSTSAAAWTHLPETPCQQLQQLLLYLLQAVND